MAVRTLTALEVRVLDYAEAHPDLSKLPHEIDEFRWRAPIYLSRLFTLLDDPASAAARPMLVHRLRRQRDAHRDARDQRLFRRA